MQNLHLIQLAITGLLVALLPLTLVWVSSDANKYRKLVWVTLFFTFDLILFGAFTRLTDSGLGCPDWPGCYGQANPWQADSQIRAAESLMPHGPVTVTKAWIEMIHRYLAMAIGVLIVAMMATAWRLWLRSGRKNENFLPWMPTALFFMVCVQGAFGAWTVTLKLQPLIVTIHLVLGMALLAMLSWFAARQSAHADTPIAVAPATHASHAATPGLRVGAWLAAGFLLIQIALGGWVSTNYATLACTDFPLCQGALLPEMDFSHGFSLWRELGKTANGAYLPFAALTAIHWLHRSFALLVLIVIAWVACRALRIAALQTMARWILITLGLQIVTGMATIFLSWPLAIAVAHNGGAALLVLLLSMLNYRIRNPTNHRIDVVATADTADTAATADMTSPQT